MIFGIGIRSFPSLFRLTDIKIFIKMLPHCQQNTDEMQFRISTEAIERL